MHRNPVPLFVPFVLCAAAAAQGPFAPAPEVAKLDRLAGHFQGSGQVWSAADAPPGEWTAAVTCKKALGGHYLREDTAIDLGEQVPTPLLFTTFYGFDREAKRHVAYGISNQGSVAVNEIHWVGENKMVWTDTGVFEGMPKVERWEVEFKPDGYSLLGEEAVGDGPFHTHVRGVFTRAPKKADVSLADAAFIMGNGTASMVRFRKMAGTYRLQGTMVPAVGQPEMPIAGTETLRMIFGGTVLEMVVHGDPAPGFGSYEGFGAIAWNPRKQCYDSFWVDNMGDGSSTECRWSDDGSLIMTGSRLAFGQPMVERSVLQCDENGRPVAVKTHAITAGHEPVVNFQAKYVAN